MNSNERITESEILREILINGMVDSMLRNLINISLAEKNEVKDKSREMKANLRAIHKICEAPKNAETMQAIAALSEEND